jgi:hypothetical protein
VRVGAVSKKNRWDFSHCYSFYVFILDQRYDHSSTCGNIKEKKNVTKVNKSQIFLFVGFLLVETKKKKKKNSPKYFTLVVLKLTIIRSPLQKPKWNSKKKK